MPALPPINPQLLMALAQKFGGIAPAINPGFGTPPFVAPRQGGVRGVGGYGGGGGGMAQRGEVLGRPAQPTPGMPRPTLGESIGSVTSGSAPAATPKKQGVKTTYDPDGGWVEEDTDGTKEVFDKNGKMLDRISPPGSAGYGVPWQPPAEAKKPGIWDRLTDPSLAGIALAAGQQLTRPRYPGETATGNAVSAVTAGYNTLAQQRQMQVARELADREWKAKQEKQAQDIAKSKAEVEEMTEKAAAARRKDRLEAAKEGAAAINKKTELEQTRQKHATEEMLGVAGINQKKEEAENTRLLRQTQLTNAENAAKTAQERLEIAKRSLDETIRNNKSQGERAAAQLEVSKRQAAVAESNAEVNKSRAASFSPYMDKAIQAEMAMERNRATVAAQTGDKTFKPADTATIYERALPNATAAYDRDFSIRETGETQTEVYQPKPDPKLMGPPTPTRPPYARDGDVWNPGTGQVLRPGPNGQWIVITR